MYRTILLAAVSLALTTKAWSQTSISYQSPRAAYLALSKDSSAKLKRNADGWEIVTVADGPNEGIWTFVPNSHPSFPSVVKRQIVERNGQLFVEMDVLCGGAKAACDEYVAEFVKINEQMAKDLNETRAAEKAAR